jgi:hypothetical protein
MTSKQLLGELAALRLRGEVLAIRDPHTARKVWETDDRRSYPSTPSRPRKDS